MTTLIETEVPSPRPDVPTPAPRLAPTPLLPPGFEVPAPARPTSGPPPAAHPAPPCRLRGPRVSLDAPGDPLPRAAPNGAVPVRTGRVRPHGCAARHVPRLQGRVVRRLPVRDRAPRHDGHGPLQRPGDRGRRPPHGERAPEVPADDGG